jgi:hypothetical protein
MAKTSTKRMTSARKTKSKGSKSTAKGKTAPHKEDHIDGCDFVVLQADITPDAALPPARGGVAGEGGKRRRRSSHQRA